MDDERFAIEIRMSGDDTDLKGSERHNQVLTAMAPALQAMLQDRFQLKLRKMTEQQPMYALTVAKGGLKLPPTPEKCYPVTAEQWAAQRTLPPPPPGFEGTLPCGFAGHNAHGGNRSGNLFTDFVGISMKNFAESLSASMDRYVLDKTGVAGRFNFRLQYAPDDNTPGDIQWEAERRAAWRSLRPDQPMPDPVKGDGPTIFKALETLGLRLEPTRGPAQDPQIDSVQRPKPN